MKNAFLAAAVLSLVGASGAMACEGEGHAEAATLKSLTVKQFAELQKAGTAKPVDANGQKTRSENGVVPGAILLTSATQYEPSKELPAQKDAQLVFYCAGTKCSASHQAAEKAISAGYTNVAVLPEGIKGWKAAGQKTATPPNS